LHGHEEWPNCPNQFLQEKLCDQNQDQRKSDRILYCIAQSLDCFGRGFVCKDRLHGLVQSQVAGKQLAAGFEVVWIGEAYFEYVVFGDRVWFYKEKQDVDPSVGVIEHRVVKVFLVKERSFSPFDSNVKDQVGEGSVKFRVGESLVEDDEELREFGGCGESCREVLLICSQL